MHLNPEVLEMFAKYSIQEKGKPPYFKRSETPEEVIKKVESINKFYLENYGRVFLKIID